MAKKTEKNQAWCCGCNPNICGWLLLIIGIYFLASHLGWIPRNIPFWPIVFIIIGIYILKKYPRK